MFDIDLKAGVINRGDPSAIMRVMHKAYKGDNIVVAFLGGSITQGCHSSTPDKCYAALIYKWWCERFPQSSIEYVNAGIGATTSYFGVSRVKQHVLSKRPDFVLTEFAVNDKNNDLFEETYEGLVRTILKDECRPALMLMNNVCYDNGTSAEEIHLKVAKHYDLPMVSMKTTILPKIMDGSIDPADITPDFLHPNDEGHILVAGVVTDYLDTIFEKALKEGYFEKPLTDDKDTGKLPDPVTENAYEDSVRIKAYNMDDPQFKVELDGFKKDERVKREFLDIFSGGFEGSRKGDRITFGFFGTGVAAQFKRTIDKPAPIALAVVDDDKEHAVILDANFDEDWGDCLYLEVLGRHLELKEHKVEITITETHDDDKAPFYLTSLIVSR